MQGVNLNAKFVDLAALSMSGSLVPSVPTQLMVKFNPPKLTIVYHFNQSSNQQFYHDIELDREMLATNSADEVVSHLFVTEAYYFNPKQVKRTQLIRLVGMVQQNISKQNQNKFQSHGQQINIQDYAVAGQQPDKAAMEAKRKNFFQKKRLLDYPQNNDDDSSGDEGQKNLSVQQQVRAPGPSGKRKRFDDLQIQNKMHGHN